MMNLTASQVETLQKLNDVFGATVSRRELMEHFSKKSNNGILPRWLMADKRFVVARGVYKTVVGDVVIAASDVSDKTRGRKPRSGNKIKSLVKASDAPVEEATVQNVVPMPQRPVSAAVSTTGAPTITIGGTFADSLVPPRHETYVPFGLFNEILSLVESKIFFPVYIVGLSGNGKTMMVEQACAKANRECIRVQITPETDEDDLIGGFRLINGETVWFDGPVTIAAQRGAVCLIDEIDYGTGKISCLQGILEGKGIFLKKINRFVPIKTGFNIIATANTKGRGSEEGGGRFMNTNIMNEAFLERFGMMFEQNYPDAGVEEKILRKEFNFMGIKDEPVDYVRDLVKWAAITRNSFDSGAVEDLITTRRLVHIVRAYAVLGGNEDLAIERCVSRFDTQVKDSFMQLWDKVKSDRTPVVAVADPQDPNSVMPVNTTRHVDPVTGAITFTVNTDGTLKI